ncbi:hypothetical protein H5410_045246 [Solanum commersonii]|uniref:Uncharacterized protein n=1 Tax=Solanum commersonii TaxID=4109 RepID=A0A9J5XC71_SOLCO|nr:hypothetical protein H5410_045246 [Solanum commersonii]
MKPSIANQSRANTLVVLHFLLLQFKLRITFSASKSHQQNSLKTTGKIPREIQIPLQRVRLVAGEFIRVDSVIEAHLTLFVDASASALSNYSL